MTKIILLIACLFTASVSFANLEATYDSSAQVENVQRFTLQDKEYELRATLNSGEFEVIDIRTGEVVGTLDASYQVANSGGWNGSSCMDSCMTNSQRQFPKESFAELRSYCAEDICARETSLNQKVLDGDVPLHQDSGGGGLSSVPGALISIPGHVLGGIGRHLGNSYDCGGHTIIGSILLPKCW